VHALFADCTAVRVAAALHSLLAATEQLEVCTQACSCFFIELVDVMVLGGVPS
jgi:hypothetical protein